MYAPSWLVNKAIFFPHLTLLILQIDHNVKEIKDEKE